MQSLKDLSLSINFSIFFEKYRLSESDDRIKDHANRKLYLELVKFKEYKKCI